MGSLEVVYVIQYSCFHSRYDSLTATRKEISSAVKTPNWDLIKDNIFMHQEEGC